MIRFLKVLYFGIYSKGVEYPRNNNLIRGLRLNGVNVIEAHYTLAGNFQSRIGILQDVPQFLRFAVGLLMSFVVLTKSFMRSPDVDAIIVGHPGYFHVHLVRFLRALFRKKGVLVYDVFIPLYEMLVEDRELLPPRSLSARVLKRFEESCCGRADLCLIDTQAHRRYLINKYGIATGRIGSVYVGPTVSSPDDQSVSIRSYGRFNILFVGTYIPLHGVHVILRAARFLIDDPRMRFYLVGRGQLKGKMKDMARQWGLANVVFQDWVPTDHLGEFIGSFDLSLGIFGETSKAWRVIPSKVYDICAAGVPFITADTAAIREVFRHKENAYLVPPGDPRALADGIRYLKSNGVIRKKIALGARRVGESEFSTRKIGRDLMDMIIRRGNAESSVGAMTKVGSRKLP